MIGAQPQPDSCSSTIMTDAERPAKRRRVTSDVMLAPDGFTKPVQEAKKITTPRFISAFDTPPAPETGGHQVKSSSSSRAMKGKAANTPLKNMFSELDPMLKPPTPTKNAITKLSGSTSAKPRPAKASKTSHQLSVAKPLLNTETSDAGKGASTSRLNDLSKNPFHVETTPSKPESLPKPPGKLRTLAPPPHPHHSMAKEPCETLPLKTTTAKPTSSRTGKLRSLAPPPHPHSTTSYAKPVAGPSSLKLKPLGPPPQPYLSTPKRDLGLKPLPPPRIIPTTPSTATKFARTINTTRVALATDLATDSGTAEVASIFLQAHHSDLRSHDDEEQMRGVDISPQKGAGKGPKFIR